METTKRSFRAARQLKLHQRCVDVLDMIVTCDKRYANAVDWLKKYDSAKWTEPIVYMNRRQDLVDTCNKYFFIKRRLTIWYVDIMNRINDVAIDYLESHEADLLLQEKLS